MIHVQYIPRMTIVLSIFPPSLHFSLNSLHETAGRSVTINRSFVNCLGEVVSHSVSLVLRERGGGGKEIRVLERMLCCGWHRSTATPV